MYEDAWLEEAYEDRCSGFVGRSEDEGAWGDDEELPECTACGDEITGAIWNGGRCLHCHEEGMLPPASGADYMPGWDED